MGARVTRTVAGMSGLAQQLNHLFAAVPRPGGAELWNNESASTEISRTGLMVSAAYLSQLRNGKRLNPSARHLAALAGLFEVPMEYFFDEELSARIDEDLMLLRALHDSTIRGITLRARELSPAGLARVEATIDQVYDLEQLSVGR